jgi:glycosyltransferase involved in cell wall biosynthesis
MKLRVGVDARLIDWPGIGRYIELLLTGLRSRTDVDVVAYVEARNVGLLPAGTTHRIISYSPFSIGEQLAWPGIVRRDRLDLFHSPHFNIPVRVPVPVVATVHDTAPLRYPPEGLLALPRRLYAGLIYRLVAATATRVITGSAFAKDDLAARTAIPAGVMTVIHHALHPTMIERAAQTGATASPAVPGYVLYVGTNKPWKNLGVALRGAALAAPKVPGLRFVIAGKQASNQDSLEDLIRSVDGRLSIEVTGTVSDEQLVTLYQGATVVLCPSLYEGFGLTGLEAMACGAPVVHSGRASLREVLGDAGLVAAAESPEEWAEAIVSIIGEPRIRADLMARGRARAEQFTLAKMVDATVGAYEEAFRSGGGRTVGLEAKG